MVPPVMSLLYKPQITNTINPNDVIIGQCALLNDQGSNHQLFILSRGYLTFANMFDKI